MLSLSFGLVDLSFFNRPDCHNDFFKIFMFFQTRCMFYGLAFTRFHFLKSCKFLNRDHTICGLMVIDINLPCTIAAVISFNIRIYTKVIMRSILKPGIGNTHNADAFQFK
jgi:hypothetical protein